MGSYLSYDLGGHTQKQVKGARKIGERGREGKDIEKYVDFFVMVATVPNKEV